MQTFKHIVFTRFDVHSASALDKDWFQYRLDIFKKYTLQSLLNQDVNNFALWIRYCKDFFEKSEEFNKYLKTLPFPVFFTIFENGKDEQTEELNEYVKDTDVVIETRVDSDDMYHTSALSEIQSQKLKHGDVYSFIDGYLYREKTNSLYKYVGTCAPFYTLVYPKDVFIDIEKKKNYFYVPVVDKNKNYSELSEGKYCVVVHDKNSTSYSDKGIKEYDLGSSAFVVKGERIVKGSQEILNNFKTWK